MPILVFLAQPPPCGFSRQGGNGDAMEVAVDEKAVAALESLYSGPTATRQLAQAREIFAFLRNEGQVR